MRWPAFAPLARERWGVLDHGLGGGLNGTAWNVCLAELQKDPLYSVQMVRYPTRVGAEDGVSLTRAEMIADRDWDSTRDGELAHLIGVHHTLWCFRQLRGPVGEQAGIYLGRARSRRDFSGREKAVMRELVTVLAPLAGGSLARFKDPDPSDLPIRVRRVFRCLLEGDTDKQVATRLGITRHTVNEYVKAIHRHFGVSSRAELLARWFRRGWGGGGFVWADRSPDASLRPK